MQARIIDGRARAERLREELAVSTQEFVEQHGIVPTLAAVLVGDDPASAIYVRRKIEQTKQVGMHTVSHHLPSSCSEHDLLALLETLNADPAIHGILLQLPLPAQINASNVLAAIDPDKDVDGFHVVNVGRLSIANSNLVPCTPTGCMILLTEEMGDLTGKHAVIVGTSNVVGRPMAQLLLQANCTVTMAHIHTLDLPGTVALGDILIVAAGVPGLIRGAWLKPGAVVIDVGINRVVDAQTGRVRIVGDVRFDEALSRASAITPVPGGVGPMTIACLLRNTLTAAMHLVAMNSARGNKPYDYGRTQSFLASV